MEEFERKNLKFNLKKEEQRLANDFLEKLGRGQSQFISLLIKNFLQNCGVVNPEELSKEEVKRMVTGFQKVMEPEEIDYAKRLMENGQFMDAKEKNRQSVTDREKEDASQTQNIQAEKSAKWSVTDREEINTKDDMPLSENKSRQSVTDYEAEEEMSDSDDFTEEEDALLEEGFDFASDLLDQLSAFGG